MALGRDDPAVLGHLGRGAHGKAEHDGDARAEDVGVDEAHRGSAVPQGQGQVDRDRGLPDAALAAPDRNDVADARQPLGARLTGGLHAVPTLRDPDPGLDWGGCAGPWGDAGRSSQRPRPVQGRSRLD